MNYINTILILICTIINCIWGIFWINRLSKDYKAKIRSQHEVLCKASVKSGICTNDCRKCAWGKDMTERQLECIDTPYMWKKEWTYDRRRD